jgi:hypothetical protein
MVVKRAGEDARTAARQQVVLVLLYRTRCRKHDSDAVTKMRLPIWKRDTATTAILNETFTAARNYLAKLRKKKRSNSYCK